MRVLEGRYVFTFLAFLANMLNLLGRDSLRLAVLPMKTELGLTDSEVRLGHSHWSRSTEAVL